jgi:transcriptional regulator with XRE-family HTH domain
VTGPDEATWRHEVGERIRYQRGAANWTQGKLGRVAGVSDHTISAYESGRVGVDLVVLARLADALRVPVTRLTGDD